MTFQLNPGQLGHRLDDVLVGLKRGTLDTPEAITVDGGALRVTAQIGDGTNLGAFGWLRAAPPQYVFDSQLTYDLQPLVFEQITSGAGAAITHSSTNRNATMTFSATPTGGKAYMQSFEHHRYQPGRGQAAFATGNFMSHTPNCLKWLKYGTGEAGNGPALESNGTGFQVTLYSDTAEGDQTVLQANWNVDKLDGTGASGLTLDVTKGVIFLADLQSLYYGRVRCCVDIDGVAICFHEFLNANRLVKPYFQSANLPISAGMTCTGTVTTSMDFTCCSVISEGGQEDIGGYHFTAEGTATAANGARTHILSVRPKTTFNGIANRSKFVLESIEILGGNSSVKWELCIGDTLTGTTTFTDVNTTYSATQFNTSATSSGAPLIVIDSGYVASSASNKSTTGSEIPMKYPITLDAAGAVRTLGTLTLLLTGIGGASACRASFNWKEIR